MTDSLAVASLALTSSDGILLDPYEIARLAIQRASDPLVKLDSTHTPAQWAAIRDAALTVMIEGGNQSGKSRTAVRKTIAYALEQHPNCRAGEDVVIWYSITTFDKFAEQIWGHFKSMLLYPGERADKLPCKRLSGIDWLKRTPETPQYFCIPRPSGASAHVYVHTFNQGRKEFQSQTVNLVVIDEECNEDIYNEIQARLLASNGAIKVIACTPIEGVTWLDGLRVEADQQRGTDHPTLTHHRLRTYDNPSANSAAIDEMRRRYKDLPEQLALRLEGIPCRASGLVYPDTIFTSAHICQPFPIPGNWSLNRCIDAGFRFPACVWIAVSPDDSQVIVYRDWKGKDQTISDSARAIRELSGREEYYHDLIDPAVLGRLRESGLPELTLWHKEGLRIAPAPDNAVRSGIDRTWQLLSERRLDGRPRFQVFSSCLQWLDERRKYTLKPVPEQLHRDVKDFGVIKRFDHLMDPTRYLVAAGLRYHPAPHRPPEAGSLAREFYDQRHRGSRS